ncbi:hypothetical protein P4B35_20675 [Pontiellaceae bacterium B12227]|nr:hypothetical protein [Pontiellaceae bacterium B12227]
MKSGNHRKSGQAILFLVLVLLIGTVAVIWNFNLHRGIVTKMRMRDAGDGAALVSARWQGITLNMVGELNLVQAVLAAEALAEAEESEEEIEIVDLFTELSELNLLRRKLTLQGPLVGFAAAQQVMLNNKIHQNSSYSDFYSSLYYETYNAPSDAADLYVDYGSTINAIGDNGIAGRTILTRSSHILYDPGFYTAIEAGYTANWWCDFVLNSEYGYWLDSYSSPGDWPDLPDDGGYSILGVDVHYVGASLNGLLGSLTNSAPDTGELEDFIDDYNDTYDRDYVVDLDALSDIPMYWAIYGSTWNNSWQDFADENNLPFRDPIVEHFDYMGPEAIYEINIQMDETFGGADNITTRKDGEVTEWMPDKYEKNQVTRPERVGRSMRWVSAAKAFGFLDVDGGKIPSYFGIVLPCFSEARLIPVQRPVHDASVNPNHDFKHIPRFLEDREMSVLEGYAYGSEQCTACRNLIWFDNATVRSTGQSWISDPGNSDTCQDYGGGGGGGGSGGAPFGH